MKHFSFSLFITILTMPSSFAFAQVPAIPGWTLVWNDEFDGEEVNATAWEVLNLRDSHNNEKQFYVADQVTVGNGKLHITATNEPMDGKPYRSGRLWTRQGWTHGRFEAKAKLPTTQGMWPAIWLLPRDAPWPTGGEIDIMENRGSEPHQVSSAYHWGKSVAERQYVSHPHAPQEADGAHVNFHDSFHIYAVEWEPETLRFYVDGSLHFTITGEEAPIPSTPMSVVLNLAVGGMFGGEADTSTVFPQVLSIDYVRIWKKVDSPLPKGEKAPMK